MENTGEESFKKLIRKAELDTPSLRFTEKIMQQIEAEAAQSMAFEPKLQTLLQRHALETPSIDFTKTIMAKTAASKTVYAPIIPQKAWYYAAAIVTSLIGLIAYFWKTPNPTIAQSPQSPTPVQNLTELSRALTSIPSTYALGLFAICTLLLLDYFLRYKTLKIT
ncbi:hypothetical protein [Runella sp.]|uniref:hypothetical protein n=1 Tax=Runella sp. TaxID=1960881 RepID=UPI003D0FA935